MFCNGWVRVVRLLRIYSNLRQPPTESNLPFVVNDSGCSAEGFSSLVREVREHPVREGDVLDHPIFNGMNAVESGLSAVPSPILIVLIFAATLLATSRKAAATGFSGSE